MRVRLRLQQLERTAQQQRPVCEPPPDLWTENGWLERFENWERQGKFAGEPDFPLAMATFRQSLEHAMAQTDPPFEPPADFMAHVSLAQRRRNWRDHFRFPDLDEAFCWLVEMLERVAKGRPAVTKCEFHDLEAWFQGQEEWLDQQEKQGLLDLGNGRTTTCANIRYGLWKGPRALGATEVVEDLRALRQQCSPVAE